MDDSVPGSIIGTVFRYVLTMGASLSSICLYPNSWPRSLGQASANPLERESA
jgi:hypothetical protein